MPDGAVTTAKLADGAITASKFNSTLGMLFAPDGKVGIGVTTPGYILDVGGRMSLRSGTAGTAGIWLQGTRTANAGFIGLEDDGRVGLYGPGSSWGLVMNTTNGNVGVGTDSPKSKLDVNGAISAGNVMATNGFTGPGTIPLGGIIMWSGATNQIPAGWALCNGQTVNGQTTPNLCDRFIIGAGANYNRGNSGGSDSVTLTTANMPSHTHDYKDGFFAESGIGEFVNRTDFGFDYIGAPSEVGSHSTDHDNDTIFWRKMTTESKGSGTSFKILPPYYALCYIMRVQ